MRNSRRRSMEPATNTQGGKIMKRKRSKSLALAIGFIAGLFATTAALLGTTTAFAEPGTQSELTAISGQGAGFVSISPTAQDQGNLFVENEVNLHDALPDTTFTVQRAVDFAPADVASGVCRIASGPPFGWQTEGTFTTSAGGAGTLHISGSRPPLSGTRFNLILRVLSQDGTQLLMSRCMTVTVK